MELIIQNADFEDEKTWKLLSERRTSGVFQVEGAQYTDLLENLKIGDINTLIDSTALIRPGITDADMLDVYVNRAIGREKIKYDHPLLEPILKDTKGIFLFQEQTLMAANKIAGYTLAEADLFRKAISSKKEDMLAKERGKFVSGCQSVNGLDEKTANHIFDQIVTFAGYAFNKSHSVCYALISYWTAYLKANFPLEYMTSLLGSQDKEDNIRKYIREAKDSGFKIMPPDINESLSSFSIAKNSTDTILFGLSKIKGISDTVAKEVISKRPYTGFLDFLIRTERNLIDSRLVETFLRAGCFRTIEKKFTTKQILENLDQTLNMLKSDKFISPHQAAKRSMQVWEMHQKKRNKTIEYSDLEFSCMERETMGFYISTHPLKHLKNPEILMSPKYSRIGTMEEAGRDFYTIGVLADKVRTRKSRRGTVFSELEIEDELTLLKLPIFGNKHQYILEDLKPGDVLALKMRKSKGKVYTEKMKKIELGF